MDKRVMDKVYAEKKAYVEQTLADMLRPMERFGSIQYARDTITNEEYVKLVEADGYPWYINVTGNSLESIGMEVCGMVGTGHFTPNGLVSLREKQRVINKMFGGK